MPDNENQDQALSPDTASPNTDTADIHDLNFAEVGQQVDDQPRGGEQAAVMAQQGPAPADLAERPAPPVPTPSEHGLSARQVERLLGEGDNSSGNSDARLDVSES